VGKAATAITNTKKVRLTVAGKAGDDAKHYQEKHVRKAIQESQK
jgi:hypothetical protein